MKPGDNVRVIGGPKEFRGREGRIVEVRPEFINSVLVEGLHGTKDWQETFALHELEIIS